MESPENVCECRVLTAAMPCWPAKHPWLQPQVSTEGAHEWMTSSCSGRQNPLQASAFPSQQSLLAALALRFRAFALGFTCTATSPSCWPSKIRLHSLPGSTPALPGPTHSQHEIPWPCRSCAVEAFRLQPWVPTASRFDFSRSKRLFLPTFKTFHIRVCVSTPRARPSVGSGLSEGRLSVAVARFSSPLFPPPRNPTSRPSDRRGSQPQTSPRSKQSGRPDPDAKAPIDAV